MTPREAQRALIELGYNLGPSGADGKIGPASEAAIRAFQSAAKTHVDGKLGPLTYRALEAALAAARAGRPVPPAERLLTSEILTKLARSFGGRPSAKIVDGIVEHQQTLIDGGINTPGRLAEFIAQACLETDYFKTLVEYSSGKAYEGRRDLGNVVDGDGPRYKGRGIFQCTGRANYARYGDRIGVPLLAHPELASEPANSVRIAALYWNDKGLNAYADKGLTNAISRGINRGNPRSTKAANHEADRAKIALAARKLLGA